MLDGFTRLMHSEKASDNRRHHMQLLVVLFAKGDGANNAEAQYVSLAGNLGQAVKIAWS